MTPTTQAREGATTALIDTVRLTHYLARPLDLAGPLGARLLTGGRSNPTFEIRDGERSWILRRQPFGLVLDTAHNMGREYRVMSALHATSVPVPRMIALCEDAAIIGAPFYVMEKLEGLTIGSRADAERLTSAQRRALAETFVETFATLHSIDVESVGLGDFGRADGYLSRQLRRWSTQWESAHSRERALVPELLGRLGASLPETRFPGIVHGDVKLDNLMVDAADPGRAIGLLDWEMSTLGDTVADLGLLWAMWDEPGRAHHPLTRGVTDLPGFPGADEMVGMYALARGIDPGPIHWYAGLADLKLAIILEQIHVRKLQGGATPGIDDVGEMVDPILERALRSLRLMA